MAAKGATYETDILAQVFNSTALSWAANTTLYISLHTAALTSASSQSTSEANYTGYARVGVTRSGTSGFTVSGGSVTNAGAVTFGACTAGSNTVTYFAIGTASSGAGEVLYWGALTSSLSISSGITPQFAASALTVTES